MEAEIESESLTIKSYQRIEMKYLIGIISILCSNSLFAVGPWHSGNMGANLMWTIAGGPARSSNGTTQNLTDTLGVPSTYYSSGEQNSTLGVGELFLGFYKELNNSVQGQLGLELAYGGNVGVSGTILVNPDINSFENITYQYQVRQIRAAVKGKLVLEDFPATSLIQPYVSAGMGVGYNTAMNYSLSASVTNDGRTYPLFDNRTVHDFTFTAGGGFQIPINPFMQLGIGYEYASWGKSELGASADLNQIPVPSLNHINVNTLLVSLSYTA